MTTEAPETPTPGTPETPTAPATPETPAQPTTEEQEAEAAFAEGFDKATEEDSPAPTPKEAKTETPPETPAAPAPETPPAPKPPTTEERIQELFDKMPGLEAQFNQRLEAEIRKVYSTVGNTLKNFKPGKPTLKLQGALKRLEKEYPEIAQMLQEDLAEALASPETPATDHPGEPPAAIKPEDIDARINQAVEATVAKVSQQYETKLLTSMHSDWQMLTKEKEFDTFLKSLPGKMVPVTMADGRVLNFPEKAKEYIESDDALVTAKCFTEYKGWKAAQQQSRTQKQERLEDAITPAGGTPPRPATLDDEAAFLDGFNSAGGAS